MSNYSDGLFTVNCDTCHTVFPAEQETCSCGQRSGKLLFDVDKALDRIYTLSAADKKIQAVDTILDIFYHLTWQWDFMNELLTKADVSRMNTSCMVSILSSTFKYSEQVSSHTDFLQRVEVRLRETGESEERIESLVRGLRGAGNYWERMKGYPPNIVGYPPPESK